MVIIAAGSSLISRQKGWSPFSCRIIAKPLTWTWINKPAGSPPHPPLHCEWAPPLEHPLGVAVVEILSLPLSQKLDALDEKSLQRLICDELIVLNINCIERKKNKNMKIWVRMNNLCLFLNQPRENWHSLNNVWLCVFDNRVCIRSNNAFLHSIAPILAWASYCAKIDFPKTVHARGH